MVDPRKEIIDALHSEYIEKTEIVKLLNAVADILETENRKKAQYVETQARCEKLANELNGMAHDIRIEMCKIFDQNK